MAYSWGGERAELPQQPWLERLPEAPLAGVDIGLAAGTLGLIDDGIDGSEVTTQLAVVTLVMAAAYLPIGAYRRQLGDPKVLLVVTVGVLAFGALALGALLAEGRLAQCLLAAAWLGHGAWDFAHHRVDKVVRGALRGLGCDGRDRDPPRRAAPLRAR